MDALQPSDLKKYPFFHCFSQEEMWQLLSDMERISLTSGEFLFREGDPGQALFLIEQGEVEVLKREGGTGRTHALSVLGKGSVVGEMVWLEKGPRFASAKALVTTDVLLIPLKALSLLKERTQLKVHQYLSRQLSQRLKATGKLTVSALKKQLDEVKARLAMNRFIVYLTVLIFLYFYSMIVIRLLNLKVVSSTVISLPILTVFGLMMIHMMQRSGYPLKTYGLTWKNGTRSLFESLGITAIVIGLLILAKWLLVGEDPLFKGIALFQPSYAGYSHGVAVQLSLVEIALLIGGYCIFTPVQELIYRGALQSSLQTFFVGRHKVLSAILISNLPFSMIHLHLSFSLAIAVYFFGMLWGWMYARHKTLVGVIVSHLIIGAFAFFILGIQEILRA